MSLPFIFPSTILVIMSTICMVMLHQISPAHAAQHAQLAQHSDREHVKEGQYLATQRSLLGDTRILFFVRAPDRDQLIPVEVDAEGTVQSVFDDALADYAANYELSLDGEHAIDRGERIADTGITMEATVQLQPTSDCARLERAFRDTDVQQKRGWTAVTTPDSCCSFDGVTCNEIVRPPRITQIILRHKSGGPKLTGSVHMELFQQMSRLEYVSLGHNDFSGNVDLSHLPDSLETLSLHHNNFEGTPSLTNLPSSLQRLHLSDNKFSGCPALSASQLPPLQYLDLRDSGLDISEQDQQEIRQRIQHAFF
mmetsp:Transcript_53825/g.86105  ORF Transcript_53825/g.86105 Transcript_53825/m.86105 type:complete len:310 (-) Transcript_53825:33-962(-)